jgi:cystathionine beta-lyase
VEADCYGGTFRLLKIFKEKYNITVHFANFLDFEMLEHILTVNPIDLVLCESPTNPGLKIIDLEAVANLSHKYNALFAVDNSLATFISQRPLDLGADFSLFSTTKNNPVKKPKKFFTHIKGSSSIYLTKEQLKGFDIC